MVSVLTRLIIREAFLTIEHAAASTTSSSYCGWGVDRTVVPCWIVLVVDAVVLRVVVARVGTPAPSPSSRSLLQLVVILDAILRIATTTQQQQQQEKQHCPKARHYSR